MYHPIVDLQDGAATPAPTLRGSCLVAGCPCKDARFVSRRRAAFHAAIARGRGETADRIVAVDPAWRLP